ncbi:uncharacterized protein LOC120067929 [Benincasa hispida]|uniref:uncharacterized protein LOC120067929 n=1 Tax=Benincasa hispida TaxID=102211 RepID=UPI001900CF0B|nr:uncharacterized protein LOC120067929 [Benincasa hispida]
MKSINSLDRSISSTNSAPFLFPSTSAHRHRRLPLAVTVTASSRSSADKNNNNYYASGKVVDESMIVLRKRIHEIKMAEQSHEPPADWLDWEKRYYSDYDSHICEALGYLQTHLMNTRPSVALGMLLLITLSVPFSSAILLHRFFQIAAALLAGFSPS